MDINKRLAALTTLLISLAPNTLVQQKYCTNSYKIRYNSILIPQTISSIILLGQRIWLLKSIVILNIIIYLLYIQMQLSEINPSLDIARITIVSCFSAL
jgi:hypothetical protein